MVERGSGFGLGNETLVFRAFRRNLSGKKLEGRELRESEKQKAQRADA